MRVWLGNLTLDKKFVSLSFPIKDYVRVILIIYKHYVQING